MAKKRSYNTKIRDELDKYPLQWHDAVRPSVEKFGKQADKEIKELQERTTTLEQLLQNIIAAHCGHYADVDRVVAVQRAITEADEFLNV